MKLSEFQWSRLFLALVKGHSDFKVKCLTFGLYTQVSNSGPLGPLVYFLVLGSADPIFLKTRIKIKVTLICFIFIFSADLNFPPQNEIKVD